MKIGAEGRTLTVFVAFALPRGLALAIRSMAARKRFRASDPRAPIRLRSGQRSRPRHDLENIGKDRDSSRGRREAHGVAARE